MSPNEKTLVVSLVVLTGMAATSVVAIRSLLGGTRPPAAMQPASFEPLRDEQIQRGAYLWTITLCADCHTAKDAKGQPIPGMSMAGHPAEAPLPTWNPSMLEQNNMMTCSPTATAFAGPWGVSVAPNLTPCKETGIGTMTADDLIASWRSNKHWKHDRQILPPMPAHYFASMTDADIRALHAFLMTLPPVKNKAPESIVAPTPG